jgi:hypothetical protein
MQETNEISSRIEGNADVPRGFMAEAWRALRLLDCHS